MKTVGKPGFQDAVNVLAFYLLLLLFFFFLLLLCEHILKRLCCRKSTKAMIYLQKKNRKLVSWGKGLFLDLELDFLLEAWYWLEDGFSPSLWQLPYLLVHVSTLNWLEVVESLQEWRLPLDMCHEFALLFALSFLYLLCKNCCMPCFLCKHFLGMSENFLLGLVSKCFICFLFYFLR